MPLFNHVDEYGLGLFMKQMTIPTRSY